VSRQLLKGGTAADLGLYMHWARNREVGKGERFRKAQSDTSRQTGCSSYGGSNSIKVSEFLGDTVQFILLFLLLFLLLIHHLHCEFSQQYGFTHPAGNEYLY